MSTDGLGSWSVLQTHFDLQNCKNVYWIAENVSYRCLWAHQKQWNAILVRKLKSIEYTRFNRTIHFGISFCYFRSIYYLIRLEGKENRIYCNTFIYKQHSATISHFANIIIQISTSEWDELLHFYSFFFHIASFNRSLFWYYFHF